MQFFDTYGVALTDSPANQATYYTLTESGEAALREATNKLHGMFLAATDYALLHEEARSAFALPEKLWPLIRRSWYRW